ncbi:MAG: carbohydrate kinase family protein, partial [Pleomorphochaeta sp.]
KAIRIFRDAYDIDLIFLTLGRDGSKAYYKDICVSAPTFLEVKCVDTTGAGDSFMGCSLSKVLEYGINNLNKDNLLDTLYFANAGASLVASKRGVIRILPSLSEIEALKETKLN